MPAIKKTFKKIGRGVRKFVKVCFRIAAFLVLLVVLGAGTAVVVAQYLVSPDALKTILSDQLQEAFHRPVQIQEVKFNLYQGIRVRGLQIFETPEFSGGTLLASDYLIAKYDWKELLHKRLDFEHITIVAPRIQLVRAADGRWNWEEILASSTTLRSRDMSPQVPLPVALFAHVISIDHGAVTIKDLRRERSYAFQGVDLAVRDFDAGKPFTFTASFDNDQEFWNGKVRSSGGLRGSVSLAGLRLEEAVFRAEEVELKSGGKTAHGSLTLKDFRHPRIEAALRLPALDSRLLGQYHAVPSGLAIPASRWKARLSFPEEGQLQVDSLTGTAGALKLQANGSLTISKESKPFHLAWNVPATSLQEASGVWDGLRKHELTGRAAINGELVGDLMDLEHTLAVQQASLNLQDFGGFFFKNSRLAHVDAWLSGTRNFETLSVAVLRGSLTSFGNLFSNVDFSAKISKGDLAFERFNGVWGNSHFKLSGLIQRLSAPTEIRVEGAVDTLRLDYAIDAFLKLLEQLKARHPQPMTRARRLWSKVFKYSIPKSFPATSGHVRFGEVIYPAFQTFDLDVQWDLRGISTGLRQSNGNVRIGFGPGRVTDIPALEDQDPHNILRMVFLPFVFMHRMNKLSVISAATAYPKSLDFNRIYGDYGVKKGIADVRLFHVDSGSLLAFADGMVDFPQEKIDLHILTRMTESRGPLPEYLTDEKGRPSIGFYVEDNLNKPTLKIEYRKMAADAIETSLQKGRDRGRDFFRAKGGAR